MFFFLKFTLTRDKLPEIWYLAVSYMNFNITVTELSPLKYNSKLMNSIWGLYNRYSPHNIKSTNEEPAVVGDLQQYVLCE